MDLQTLIDVFCGLMCVLYVTLVGYGSWLFWGKAIPGDEDSRPSTPQPAARLEGAVTPSRAKFDYFPENYLNQGRDGDGVVMTYERD